MSVFKTKDKTKDGKEWVFFARYIDLNGNIKQYKSKKYTTKKEAMTEERAFLLKLTNNIDTEKLTLKNVYTSYLNFQKDRLKETSIIAIENRYKYLSDLDKIILKDLAVPHFNLWKDKMDKTDLSTSYKNTCFKLLKSILRYANVYLGISNSNVLKFTNFSTKNELKKEMDYFTIEEFNKFISIEHEITFRCFFKSLYYCGLRQGEAQALCWDDINFENNTISIVKTLTTKIKGKRYVIMPPKTKSSNRIMPIPKTLLNDLLELFKEKSKILDFSQKMFVFGDIYPLATTTIQNRKNSNCKEAGVHQIRIHDFRHSCASLLINNGANITLVAKYLGHTNIATTLNVYSHMYKSQLDEIVNIIDKS